MLTTCPLKKREGRALRTKRCPADHEAGREAFAAESLRELGAVYSFSLSLTGDPHVAEDVTQETFLNAYRGFHHFELGTNCKAWLFKICKNVVVDRFRRGLRRPAEEPLENSGAMSFDPTIDQRAYEERGLDSDDVHEVLFSDEINRSLAELPGPLREALLLCDLEELSYREIAEVMQTPLGTVRSRISRARRFLKERLETKTPGKG